MRIRLFHARMTRVRGASYGRADEGDEQRVRLQRLRLELGMELAAEEPGMVGDLADLDVRAVGRLAGDAQAGAVRMSSYSRLNS